MVASVAGRDCGILTLRVHTPYAAEIVVMGVLPEHHRAGIGLAMLEAAESWLAERDVAYLQVKTLSPRHPDSGICGHPGLLLRLWVPATGGDARAVGRGTAGAPDDQEHLPSPALRSTRSLRGRGGGDAHERSSSHREPNSAAILVEHAGGGGDGESGATRRRPAPSAGRTHLHGLRGPLGSGDGPCYRVVRSPLVGHERRGNEIAVDQRTQYTRHCQFRFCEPVELDTQTYGAARRPIGIHDRALEPYIDRVTDGGGLDGDVTSYQFRRPEVMERDPNPEHRDVGDSAVSPFRL